MSRIRASGRVVAEGLHELLDPPLEQVVAEVHDKWRVAQELLGRQDGVGQAQRGVLDDVGELHAEARRHHRPQR